MGKSHERIGRPPKFNREEALNRAMHVFWQKGFEGASLIDLTSAMGIQPASLYGAFGNKEALFEQVLTRYLAGPVAFMHDALQEPTAFAVAERILRRTADFLTARRSRSGCMTIQAALVGGVEAKRVRKRLIALRLKEQDALRQRFDRAKSDGDLPDTVEAADLARFVTCLFQGMTVQAINGATREELFRLSEIALRNWPKWTTK